MFELFTNFKAGLVSFFASIGIGFAYFIELVPDKAWLLPAAIWSLVAAWSLWHKTQIAREIERDRKKELEIRHEKDLPFRRKFDALSFKQK